MPSVLIAHPSPDLYGSDRQLLESIEGLKADGWDVTVHLPSSGPLTPLLEKAGAAVEVREFPVLRRSTLTPRGLLSIVLRWPSSLARTVGALRAADPDVVYVNTVTIPLWVIAARICRIPLLVHVHEAEEGVHRIIRTGLAAPLLLATGIVTNSASSRRVLTAVLPRLDRLISVIPNGVPAPDAIEEAGETGRLVVVARLSPRKGVDVALEAVALLRAQGRAVSLDVCGSVFAGYEWFEDQLRERASRVDLAGAIRFLGYVSPTWPLLARANVVLVPSRVEPFGNTAVEGLLARRTVVASGVQGLAEIVDDGRTGLLVRPDDAHALAQAIARVLDEPEWAGELARVGCEEARQRFSVERYRADIATFTAALLAVPQAAAKGIGAR